MLNKSHPLSRYKANSGKNNNKKNCLMHFDPGTRVFVLSKIFNHTLLNAVTHNLQLKLDNFSERILLNYCCLVIQYMESLFEKLFKFLID